ncbi:MAG: hypothetical protein B7X08_00975 [Acidocella sp. 20-63-7]|nr:MAG: hypothetical protein B7X08_00975 [Acidocella sp. 20-63-7]HQT45799.1 glycosyltransferase family 1 protein [Acidocella sp.]
MTIWFDVGDLIRFFQNASRPTGIQRLSFETYRALWTLAGESGEVRFCHRGDTADGFKAIHFPALEAAVLAAFTRPVGVEAAYRAEVARPVSKLGRAARRLPAQYRLPLGQMVRAARTGVGAAGDLIRALGAGLRPGSGADGVIGGQVFALNGDNVCFGPGDWFISLGVSWETPYSETFLSGLRADGTRFAMLAYDLIPELFPEWCAQSTVRQFSAWLSASVPMADLMFAISRHTADDLVACMARREVGIVPPVVLPVGSHERLGEGGAPLLEAPYVLMVGTIEARKNHGGMLRVWRRLLQDMPEGQVPELVFAGKLGWLTDDLMQQLENADWLGGKIRLIERPSDAELARLYQDCLFCVFPSFYEGWGLPVTESLSHGKMVAASNRSAIREAGGEFCAYFDPENTSDICTVIRGLIEAPERVAAMERRIAETFYPPGWDETAAALLQGLRSHAPVPCPAPWEAPPVELSLSSTG